MIGNISITVAFYTAVAVVLLTIVPFLHKKLSRWAGAAFFIHIASVLTASAYLLAALLQHQFQYHYVYANTDSSLSWPYLLSAFWAGQQGSFLFWALCGALVSWYVLSKHRLLHDEPVVLSVLMAGQAFLTFLILRDSPFKLMSSIPVDGRGLNPMLLNPWMVVHPPVIFVGYALLVVPFAFSLASLLHRQYHEGLKKSLPWAVAGWLFLGAGILIGGVWAYQVLGWGGYWGWDPVENASLIPWLICSALVHGLLVHKRGGGFTRVNHFLAISTYLLVLTATFITRSGIMADYSVHAFAQTPLTRVLLLFVGSFAVVGCGVYALRYKDLQEGDESHSPLSQSTLFAVSMGVLGLSALVILLGTLSPIITGWVGLPASVDTSFYLLTNTPLAFALLLLLGFLPAMGAKVGDLADVLALPVLGLAVAVLLAFLTGVRSPVHLLFIGAGGLALASNSLTLWQTMLRRGVKHSGAYLAHIGLALLLVGVLISTSYTREEVVFLSQGKSTDVLGYRLTWLGGEPEASGDLTIEVRRGGYASAATPKMYMAGDRQMREPGIKRHLWTDVYISPIEMAAEFPGQFLVQQGRYFTKDDWSFHFQELKSTASHAEGQDFEVIAVLLVRYIGDVQTITPSLKVSKDGVTFTGEPLPHSDATVFLQAVDANQGLAWFTIGKEAAPRQDVLVVEVKTKPFVLVLAVGAALLVLGTGVACWRRFMLISN